MKEPSFWSFVVYDSKRIRDFAKLSLDIALLPGRGIMACNVMWGNRRTATINSIDLWIHYFHRHTPAIPFPCKPTKENIRDSESMADIMSTFIPRIRYYLYNPSQISICAWSSIFFRCQTAIKKATNLFRIICNNVKRLWRSKCHDETQSLFLCECDKSTTSKRQRLIC